VNLMTCKPAAYQKDRSHKCSQQQPAYVLTVPPAT
jgi:hypothetical protein